MCPTITVADNITRKLVPSQAKSELQDEIYSYLKGIGIEKI